MSDIYDGEALFAKPADQENGFTALPMDHPVVSTLITPAIAVQFMADHLAAAAGVLRTRMTVLAFVTVVRSSLGAAALAHYTADPDCDTRERVRRALNVMLDADKEMMLFSGVNTPAVWEASTRTESR